MTSLLFRALPMAGVVASAPDAGYSGGNLADWEPRRVYRATTPAPWALVIDVDLGGDTPVDSAALLYNSVAYTCTVTAYSRTEADGPFGAPFDNSGAAAWGISDMYPVARISADYTHSLAFRSAPITARYVRLTVYAPAYEPGKPAYFQCGAIAIGKRWQPADGHDWGAQRGVIDQSVSRILQDGGRALEEGARLTTFRASYSGLTDGEKADLWGLLKAAGIGAPFVLVEDPAQTPGLIERIHYGTLTRINPIERTMPEKSRFELEFTEWL